MWNESQWAKSLTDQSETVKVQNPKLLLSLSPRLKFCIMAKILYRAAKNFPPVTVRNVISRGIFIVSFQAVKWSIVGLINQGHYYSLCSSPFVSPPTPKSTIKRLNKAKQKQHWAVNITKITKQQEASWFMVAMVWKDKKNIVPWSFVPQFREQHKCVICMRVCQTKVFDKLGQPPAV